MELERVDAAVLEQSRQLEPQTLSSPSSPPKREGFRGVPPSRREDTFDSFDLKRAPEMREAYEQCRQVSSGEAWCAFLLGGPGNGKTHLAIAAMGGVDTAQFWKVPDFLAFLRSRIDTGDVEKMVETYRSAGFLFVLDDLGTENPTDWANEQLYRMLDRRSDQHAPKIITSNQPHTSIDERLRSRFREGYVACGGKDQRGR